MFVEGRIAGLLSLVFVFLCIELGLRKAGTQTIYTRPIAGLEAIEEAVGRATEMGKPIVFTPGYADIAGTTGAASLAGIDVLNHVARLAARYDTGLSVVVGHPNTYALVVDILKTAYLEEGKPDVFNPDNIRFTSDVQFAFTAAVLGQVQREKPATVFYTGYFAAEAIVVAEAAATVDAMTIAGTTNYFQIPFFVAACDYTMIGEELLAAGAFISKDPKRIGAIAGQDYVKIATIIMTVAGAILSTMGLDILTKLLSK
ncbi:MAG TPA: hypothetical protein PLB36_06295 [Bacillota bacterium]|nr:hypothetical protein [Candidatus Fermentithermobacillaceae bacterium]HOB31027.1 hypothetical protein [Bacillota bacterium]HOK64824.1 hypothetical protein [Bacillota bacterium]HOL12475.1 hypothetical protein [Bacillota bacterium]HOQ03411.1 hypothetical protein [Bacillota bacterium]